MNVHANVGQLDWPRDWPLKQRNETFAPKTQIPNIKSNFLNEKMKEKKTYAASPASATLD